MIEVGCYVTIGRSSLTWRVIYINDRQTEALLQSGQSERRRREPLFNLHFFMSADKARSLAERPALAPLAD